MIRSSRLSRGLGWLSLGLAGLSGPADAAVSTAPAAPAPASAAVSAEPAVTSATYGDWVLRCRRFAAPAPGQRLCDVSQTLSVKGQARPVAEIVFGKATASDPLKATVAVPNDISIPGSVRMFIGQSDQAVADLGWRRCTPRGCIADLAPAAEALKAIRATADGGRILFQDAEGRTATVPFSFRGLAQALDALAKS